MTTSTRDTLVAAATVLLDDGGASAVTLRQVGHRSGVSHNAPYKHFSDKSELLAAVATAELEELAAVLSRRDGAGRVDLDAVVTRYVERALAHPHRFQLVYGPWPHAWPDLTRAADAAWQQLLAAVADAQAQGTLPTGPPVRIATLLRATIHGAVVLQLTGHLEKQGPGHAAEAPGPREVVSDLLDRLRGT